jgi:glycosyltransferase involved in cell wall biosynthesis
VTTVSVIVPAHQAEHYLAAAVRSALDQTHDAIEVIVVDDGSTDATLGVARALAAQDPRVAVVHRPSSGGPARARNDGLAAANGTLIAFLDADDVYRPDKVARQVAYLEDHADVDVVFSDHEVTDAHLEPLRIRRRGLPDGAFLDLVLLCNWFHIGSALTRRSTLDKIGGFDPEVLAGEDHDLWIRIADVAHIGYLPGVVLAYRTTPGQRKSDIKLKRAGWRSIRRRHRSRPRAQRRLLHTGICWNRASLEWERGSRARAVLDLCALMMVTRHPSRIADVRRLSRYDPVNSDRANAS